MVKQSFTFSWEIRNFGPCTADAADVLESDLFKVPILNDTSWIIQLFPRGDNVSIFLVRMRDVDGPETIDLSVTFRLIAADGTVGHEQTETKSFKRSHELGFIESISLSEIQEHYLVDDILRLDCVLRKTCLESVTRDLVARTDVEVVRTSHNWNLKKFSHLRHGDVVTVGWPISEGGVSTFLDIEQVVVGRIGRETVTIRFVRLSVAPRIKTLSVIAKITVLYADDSETDIWKKDRFVFRKWEQNETWEFPTFISKATVMKQKDKYLWKDVLTLKCDMSISSGVTSGSILRNKVVTVSRPDAPPINKWTEDMEDLRISERFADVRLRASDGDTVASHRLVLSSRSRIFAKMLDPRKRPDDEGVLDVPEQDSQKGLDNVLGSRSRIFAKMLDRRKRQDDESVLDEPEPDSQEGPDNVLGSKSKRFAKMLDLRIKPADEDALDVPELDSQKEPDHVLELRFTAFTKMSDTQKRPEDLSTLNLRPTSFTKPLNYLEKTDEGVLDLSPTGSFQKFDFDRCPDENGILDVHDLDMSTLKRMLKFMYTEETEDLGFEDAVKLYVAACNYQIVPLQCACFLVFQSGLKVGNVCRVLMLAHDYSDIYLKNCAMDFIRRYWYRIALSEEWIKLCKERKILAWETRETLHETLGMKGCLKVT